jgi:hypothetical protein
MATPVIDQVRTYLSMTAPFWIERHKAIAVLISHPGVTVEAINAGVAELVQAGELVERASVVKDDQGNPTIFWREGRPL